MKAPRRQRLRGYAFVAGAAPPVAGGPAGSYTRIAVVLHWAMAVMMVCSFAVGWYMTGLPMSVERLKLYTWHKWAGILILALAGLRLGWRLRHPPPSALPMPRWQARAAKVAHLMLYGLFFAVPVVGWAYSSAAGVPVVLFGVWSLPNLAAPDRELAAAIKPWHARLAWLLAAVVALHVAGALKHQLIDRDGSLRRMAWK